MHPSRPRRFLERGCDVWGLDFSLEMLAKVHRKFPQVELLKADIKGDWPIDVDRHFDRVVSAYVLHEFDLESKVRLLRKLVCDHLIGGGRVVVGDTIMVDAYVYKSHETVVDRASGREPDGGTWALFDGLNPYTGGLEPAGNGCQPTPGAANECEPTQVSEGTWGRVKNVYR